MINYDKFRLSLKRLEEQHANLQRGNPAWSELDREGITESVIQRFETCYDCLWKVLRRYMNEDLGLPDVPSSPNPIFKIAYKNNLLQQLEPWLRYVDARIGTSHDYDGKKAIACLELIPEFIDDAIGLYQPMTNETWE